MIIWLHRRLSEIVLDNLETHFGLSFCIDTLHTYWVNEHARVLRTVVTAFGLLRPNVCRAPIL